MSTAGNRRLRDLLDAARLAHPPREQEGYLDLGTAPEVRTPGQRLMRFAPYAAIYQGFRPLAYRAATGWSGPDEHADFDQAVRTLRLEPGHVVLDLCCGPGNFTGGFGRAVGGDGLAVGLDASTTMLAVAVRDNDGPSVAYARGDAAALPFADASIDAVSCFAALYLVDDPYAVLTEMVRVLRPGGRLAVLTSWDGPVAPVRLLTRVTGLVSGVRMFGRDDVTGHLRSLGLADVDQQLDGLAQKVSATRPAAPGRR